jgi:glycosyl hydrolase family 26
VIEITRRFVPVVPHLLLALAFFACSKQRAVESQPQAPMELVVPEKGAYTGAFIDFGDREDEVTLEAIEDFEKLVGKHQAIVASSSYWGEQTFPTENVNLIWRHGSIPLIFWSPWDRPYEENRGPDKFSLTNILAGQWNEYIDRWGEAAHKFGQPMFVSFANEMNGDWFPWSGTFYGGPNIVPGTNPPQYEGTETFKKAYRYVVDRVRAKGGTNVLWVLHLMDYSYPPMPGNYAADYYPGKDYVDWLGLSVYGAQFSKDKWATFAPLLEWPYKELCALDPDKPVMLTEWGCGEYPDKGSKAQWFKEGFGMMKSQFPRLKAAIYWHERWQNPEGSYSNLRVNSSPESLEAYRAGVADPHWIGQPILRPRRQPLRTLQPPASPAAR